MSYNLYQSIAFGKTPTVSEYIAADTVTTRELAPLSVGNENIISVDASKIVGLVWGDPPNDSITIDKFKTEVGEANKIYAHDNNGVPIMTHLQNILNDAVDTEPLNKIYANNLRFNDVIDWNGTNYVITEHFFNNPAFLNTITYRWGTNGDFSLGKIQTEFFSGNNDIDGTNIFVNSTIPLTKLATLQADRFIIGDVDGHFTTLSDPIPSQLTSTLSNKLNVDGTNQMWANLNMGVSGLNNIINCADPVNNLDVANKQYTDTTIVNWLANYLK